MACEIISTRGAVFSLWGVPLLEDVDNILEALSAAVHENGGPVIYVTRVPVSQPAPSAEVRAYLDKHMPTITSLVSSYHVVLEGVGFAAAVKRAVLLGLFQLSWRRKTFFVHSLVTEIPLRLERSLMPAFNQLMNQASARGMLDTEGPTGTAAASARSGGRAA